MNQEPSLQRWSWLLRDLIRQQKRSLRSIEQEVGWSNGYLSLVLRDGPPAMKVEQVLAVLQAIEVPARRYFAELYELPIDPRGPGELTRDEMERVVDERIESERKAREAESQRLREDVDGLFARLDGGLTIDRDRLSRLVGEALRVELLRLAAGAEAPLAAPAEVPAATEAAPAKPRKGPLRKKKRRVDEGEGTDHAR